MKEDFNDFLMDSKLHIQTTGRNDAHSDTHRYPYEPTTYTVLDRIVSLEYIDKEDVVLDYGCGLGRVPIYLFEKIGCKTMGIELVGTFYDSAVKNRNSYMGFLTTIPEVCFVDEIDCRDLFKTWDDRNRVMIFQIG